MATATKTKPTAPWQAQIIQELEQLTGDELAGNTHAIVWIRDNGNAELLHLAESEAAATVTAEDDSTKVHGGEVTTIPLADLQAWIEHHSDELLPVAGTGNEGSDVTEADNPAEHETEAHDDTDGLPIAGTASGPDAETGQLFDVPRLSITIDDTDPTILKLSFSGSVELERGDPDQAQTFNRLQAGKVASIHTTAYVKSGPTNVHRRDSDGNVDAIVASKSLVITDIRLD